MSIPLSSGFADYLAFRGKLAALADADEFRRRLAASTQTD